MSTMAVRILWILELDYIDLADHAVDFGLSQIVPMLDEDTGAEPRVNSASIGDSFLLLVRDDASIFVAKLDKNLELEELEKDEGQITSTKWAAGCLYEDKSGVFASAQNDKGAKASDNIMMFLLSKPGCLYVRIFLPRLQQRGANNHHHRSTRCPISPTRCMWRKGYHSCHRYSQPTTQRSAGRPKRILRRYSSRTSGTTPRAPLF